MMIVMITMIMYDGSDNDEGLIVELFCIIVSSLYYHYTWTNFKDIWVVSHSNLRQTGALYPLLRSRARNCCRADFHQRRKTAVFCSVFH